MIYRAFQKQIEFHQSQARIRGAFAGKRGGKTECGAVEGIIHSEQKIGYKPTPIDPYAGIIVAPTTEMLRRLSLRKFLAYADPFVKSVNRSSNEVTMKNDSIVYGISADRPRRMEGLKINWGWLDEVFQMSEQTFLEARARVSDTKGRLWCTGSLGVQYNNPKAHWVYKYFKLSPGKDTACFEWSTADNPYFPSSEIEAMKSELDPVTFRQMFELSWDVPGTNLVYQDFMESNVLPDYTFKPELPVIVSIDWGYAHCMAVGFFQYDPRNDTAVLFDEIIETRLGLDRLWTKIQDKRAKWRQHWNLRDEARIGDWVCDIAGDQTREQTERSNVKWFYDEHQISFKYRKTQILYGIPIVRSYILNAKGQRRFYVNERMCPRSLDGIRNYSYPEKDGQLTNENPVKKDDDAVDMIRYFFVNKLDPTKGQEFNTFNRWG